MDKFYSLVLVLILLFSVHSTAQKVQLSNKEKAIIWPLHKQAMLLSSNATNALQAGNTAIADSLIRKSIEVYPTLGVFSYAELLMSLSDITGSNEILKLAYARIKNEPQKRFIMPLGLINDFRKVTVAHIFSMQGAKLNRSFGDLKSTLEAYEHLFENKLDYNDGFIRLPTGSPTGPSDDYFRPLIKEEFYNRFEYWIITEKYDEALNFIAKRPQKGFIKKEDYAMYETEIYLLKKDYAKARKAAEGIDPRFKLYYDMKIKLDEGDIATTKDFFQQYYASAKTNPANSSRFLFQGAECEFKLKNYTETLSLLEKSIARRGKSNFSGERDPFQWKIYTLMADAYAGLGEKEKARTNYDIALLYHPTYKPAIDGITALEIKSEADKLTDKSGPEILILEPVATRGFEIVAKNDMLIKGIAKDPSGLKEVYLNGTKIYSQTDGNFWGNAVIGATDEKVLIKAIDILGNVTEMSLNIKRPDKVNTAEIVAPVTTEGKNYCLLVAAQNYADESIPSLENPIADAIRLKMILKSDYNFADSNVINLFNPSNDDLKRQLLEMTNTVQPEDNIIIFYAGHGIWKDSEKKGYWLMANAKRNDVNTWLPNKDVLNLIAKIPSRHTLLITDACFSGGVFKTRSIGKNAPAAIQSMNEKISRVAITSGNDTEVPDESVFMKYLIKALSENKEQYLTAQKMFITQIIEAVMTETKTEPRYGTLELAGHIGGDFIFAKK
jgi:tetratricopeptide (TPR) repeat protein